MDIKKLTQEVLLKNMTPEQQLAVLDSVTASVKEAKAVQKQKIAENVDLVLQALKRIEADMLKRVQESAKTVEDRVKTIKDGKDGKNGIDGKAGKDGKDGKNGLDGRNGRDGLNGKAGERGQDGVGVQDAHIDFDGSLIISLTDGRVLNVGEVIPFDMAEKIRVIGNGGGTSQYVLDAIADLQTQINNFNAGLTYKGTWNASTNTPTLTSGSGTNGWYYVVGVAGSTNLNGVTDWQVGDWAIFNGTTWQKIDQTNTVTSVNGQVGAVVIGSVPTGGTAGQVLSKVDGTDYNTQWIDNYATALKFQAKNTSGSTLNKGTVVYVSGGAGANPYISPAQANSEVTSSTTVGILESTVANNGFGLVVRYGEIAGLDTSAAVDGDPVWLSPTVSGGMVYGLANKPKAPNHLVYLGTVTRSHAVNGEIQFQVSNGWELDELHNVAITSAASGNTIIYDASAGVWKNASLTAGSGVSVTNGAGSITVTNTAPDQTVVLTGSGTTSITGTYPNFTISSSDAYTGTVTSVAVSGGTTGLTTTGGPITGSGTITLSGTLAVANGGTGATSVSAAQTNLQVDPAGTAVALSIALG